MSNAIIAKPTGPDVSFVRAFIPNAATFTPTLVATFVLPFTTAFDKDLETSLDNALVVATVASSIASLLSLDAKLLDATLAPFSAASSNASFCNLFMRALPPGPAKIFPVSIINFGAAFVTTYSVSSPIKISRANIFVILIATSLDSGFFPGKR